MGEVFLGGEAVAAGRMTRHELRRWYQPIYRGVYVAKDAEASLRDRAIGAWLATGRRGVITGVAAAGLHGAPWVDSQHPIEVLGAKCTPQPGLVPRLERLEPDEVRRLHGLPVATRVRTAFDLGRHQARPEALARLDALMWNQRFDVDAVLELGERYPRSRGLRQLRELLPLVDGGAASPRESRTRLWLLDTGFPRPETQIPVPLATGMAYLDMGWEEFSVAVEYDGDQHRADRRQYVRDLTRLRMLTDLGWTVIRVIAEDRPSQWLARAEAALRERGCELQLTEVHRVVRRCAA
ncbi:hypothetical protein [Mycolicibacterium grossiae]|uniref:DUF559 domain-containing protein n=1 Tax=Mycolicibacterium grossiae TaxID=1552759 RepID=A0A1E8Q4C2_9MYCO|nr:hypothetical protein [Mycolicibacterium grossiae]OFJ53468.1 hypothetical protein BEL07_11960 [Mycolicibacterium grossiae]QEM44048.1 hypothetical protein FZ046_03955 [Mycolicibacterium grossiae]